MSDQIVTIETDFFFKPNVNVHIHHSNDCKDYLGTLHRHKFIEVVYVLSGRATHFIGDKSYTVKKGDVSIINSNEVHAFVKEIRMKEACRLLTTTQDTISEIATACGFSDMKTFYGLFKKHTGLTPKAYREQHLT